MADFSEGLYAEHKYGQDAADAHNYRYLKALPQQPPRCQQKPGALPLQQPEDVFDLVSYQKGGAMVEMLRTYLGDDVFFAGLRST